MKGVFLFMKFLHVDSVLNLMRLGLWKARGLTIGSGSYINTHVVIKRAEHVVVGECVVINEFVHIWGGGGVDIGDNVLIASHCVITSQTHAIKGELYRTNVQAKPIKLGDNVWLGAGVIILPGVEVGNNSVVGAGSVVTRNVPNNCVVAGVPAIVKRYIDGEKLS